MANTQQAHQRSVSRALDSVAGARDHEHRYPRIGVL